MNASAYFNNNGLDTLIAGATSAKDSDAIVPDLVDLSRLHRLVRERRVAHVLEFGVGFSTLVIADALARNAVEFGGIDGGRVAKGQHRVSAIDANETWIGIAKSRIPDHLSPFVDIQFSQTRAGTFLGQVCHFYDSVPDVVPEFIYLDGPDPADVVGSVNGFSFTGLGRTPLAADLLQLEPIFLPGTFILVDGRTNNVRFLARNFRRSWSLREDPDGRFATFELREAPLGARNRARLAFCRTEVN